MTFLADRISKVLIPMVCITLYVWFYKMTQKAGLKYLTVAASKHWIGVAHILRLLKL